MSSIEWTDETWNPVVGCSRVSPGCEHCYAEGVAHRGLSKRHKGLTVLRSGGKGPRWTGEVRTVPEALDKPLRRRKPTTYFVNSMSDLFHPKVPREFVAACFGVMAGAPQHTFQVLTKRPEEAREWFAWIKGQREDDVGRAGAWAWDRSGASLHCRVEATRQAGWSIANGLRIQLSWPLPNVWIGVSVEDQRRADDRIPVLLELPAAVRFLSVEPLLESVNLTPWLPSLDWVIVGGESGPGARPCSVAWLREVVDQCHAADVPVFVKQLGAKPISRSEADFLATAGLDAKGGNWEAWPEDLRVREMPEPEP
ncbi:MAG: phage Gp37/Gp68 family protein [Pigmentiphaga sp.]|nr:phage Gp37/Gp68 family protein [Pigmentiphaga sp.]